MKRKIVPVPAGWDMHGPGMVPGVIAGGFIFFSALRGLHPSTREYSDDPEEQARQTMENMKGLCEAAGATLDHVVKVTLYLADLKYRQVFHKAWMEYFPESPPARIAIEVADANAIPGRNAYFAIDVIAIAP